MVTIFSFLGNPVHGNVDNYCTFFVKLQKRMDSMGGCEKDLKRFTCKCKYLKGYKVIYAQLVNLMLERLHLRKSSGGSTHPVYRMDDRPQSFSSRMLEEMDADELWKEIEKFCEGD